MFQIVSLFQWGDDSDSDSTPSGDDTPHHLGMSIFDFIARFPIEIFYGKEKLNNQWHVYRESARSPTFHNPLYCTELHQAVLRPFSHMSDLVLWWVK